eukprot:CAMPEP_0178423098 /NCGR_PEP_ID=MMETSP0689_2-20121128/27515_1 /TAXON_ID=160604 /ORGANISM="Amphidinium massartii, Strain CS-259" /LENGTH=90 /DNA_ID=CAMNT_0020044685 /DNA_START=279 /DNA_END=551 /DNA_ORIENTATION=-
MLCEAACTAVADRHAALDALPELLLVEAIEDGVCLVAALAADAAERAISSTGWQASNSSLILISASAVGIGKCYPCHWEEKCHHRKAPHG